MTKPRVTNNEEFVFIWNAASSPAEVADHYKVSTQSAFMWAHKLRRQGYELKVYKRKISDSDFIKIWQTSATLAEVEATAGLAKATCKVKASVLRTRGFDLKKFDESDMPQGKLFLRKGILTEAQALASANETMVRYGLEPITRQLWGQSIRPLMEIEGDAASTGGKRGQWFYDGSQLWRWSEYLAKRAVLIQSGHWPAKRAYSIEDMMSLVDGGSLDGEIDHPAFSIAMLATVQADSE